jgi:hypothetical protein
MYMIRSPANEELKRTFKVNVSVLPLPTAQESIPYTAQCLLLSHPPGRTHGIGIASL